MINTDFIHTEDVYNFTAPREILPSVISLLRPKSILDVGCGIGTWLAIAEQLGVTSILGVDGDYVDRSLLKISEDHFLAHDLTIPLELPHKFDLAICLEVAEHLPPSAADTLINTLTRCSDVILFSAAIPNQGGQNHINEQWTEYWQELFGAKGFFPFDILRGEFWNNQKIEFWYKQNIIIYASLEKGFALGLTPNSVVSNLVHPELFDSKVREIDRLNEIEKNKDKVYPLIKRLVKAIIKGQFFIL